ncbi:MAG: hypothetical protein ACC652_06000 [Acidimicrobiales bacterium]
MRVVKPSDPPPGRFAPVKWRHPDRTSFYPSLPQRMSPAQRCQLAMLNAEQLRRRHPPWRVMVVAIITMAIAVLAGLWMR